MHCRQRIISLGQIHPISSKRISSQPIMHIPASMVGVSIGLTINSQTNKTLLPITDLPTLESPSPTPTVQDRWTTWTTDFPFHSPTAHLMMVPYSGYGCEHDNMLAGMAEQGMVGLGTCYPVTESASFIWYGKVDCLVTLHSGTNCEGWEWAPDFGECYDQTFGSFRAYC